MISIVSAFEFDNVKTYDPVIREVLVKNSFIGIPTTEVGKIRLNTPLNVKVGLGYQKVAEFNLNAFQDYEDIIKSINFYDLNKKDWEANQLSKDFDIKYKTLQKYEVDDYKTDCIEDKVIVDEKTIIDEKENTTQTCTSVKVGSHTETREIWTKIMQTNLQKDQSMTIGLFTNVNEGDYVEWIPKIYGLDIKEFASWEASLNSGFTNAYEFNEIAGTTASDSVGTDDGTASNSRVFTSEIAGILNTSADFSQGNDLINLGTPLIANAGAFTISAWVYTGGTINGAIFSQYASGDAERMLFYVEDVTNRKLFLQIGNSGNVVSATSYPTNEWFLATVTRSNTNNVSIYLNGDHDISGINSNGIKQVNSIIGSYGTSFWHDKYIDEVYVWDRELTASEIKNYYNEGSPPYINESSDQSPTIIFNNAVDQNYTSPQNLYFNFTAYDDVNLTDVKLYINSVLNQTNASGINNTNYIFNQTLGDGDYEIYGKATDNKSQATDTASITIMIDSTSPTITDAYNLTDLIPFSLPINSTWHYNATDEHLDSCYYNTTENATQIIITCNSTISTTWEMGGNKTITFCANDTFGLESCNTEYIYVYYVSVSQAVDNNPAGEGMDVTWDLTVGLTGIPTTTATFWINNTNYTPNSTVETQDQTYFNITLNIPDGWGNSTGIIYDWFWNYEIAGLLNSTNTSTQTLTVFDLALDDCSSYSDVILNLSLKDEELVTIINETAGSTVEVDVYVTSIDDPTLQLHFFQTFTDENNPQICMPSGLLNNSQYRIDFTIGYDSTDRVWEFFYLNNGTLNSTKIFESFNGQVGSNIDLLNLLTVDSTSFLFNYFDVDGLAIDNSIVHVMRRYIGDGEFLEVERAKADQNGDTIVHLVEEDVIYYFMITLDGVLLYTSSQYTALCQATPCTIQIEASGGSATFPTDWDLVEGGAFSISSDAPTRNVTLDYVFNATDTINLTVYKYNSDGSYSAVDTVGASGTSGSIGVTVPQVAGNVSFFASVTKGGDFKRSEWVDFTQKSSDFFGVVLSLFLSALIILSLGLFAIYEGAGTMGYVILGVIISGALGLIRTELSTGVNVVIYLVLAGGILLWKLTRGRS